MCIYIQKTSSLKGKVRPRRSGPTGGLRRQSQCKARRLSSTWTMAGSRRQPLGTRVQLVARAGRGVALEFRPQVELQCCFWWCASVGHCKTLLCMWSEVHHLLQKAASHLWTGQFPLQGSSYRPEGFIFLPTTTFCHWSPDGAVSSSRTRRLHLPSLSLALPITAHSNTHKMVAETMSAWYSSSDIRDSALHSWIKHTTTWEGNK